MKPNQTLVTVICSIIILWCGFVPPFIHPQTISGEYHKKLPDKKVAVLLDSFRQGDLKSVPRDFFQKTYDDELPDLILFIDETGKSDSVKISLLKGGRERQELFGERYVYVLVFWARPSSDTLKPCVNDAALIKLSALDRREGSGEFALFTTLKYIAAAFTKQPFGTKEEVKFTEEVQQKIKKIEIGTLGDTTLYFVLCKLPLHENTINRVHVQTDKSDTATVYLSTFGNYSPSWITSSVGFLTSFPCCCREKEKSTVYPVVDPFLFGHLYLKRPQQPKPRLNDACREWRRQLSISFAVGTRLSDKLFEDLFVGGSVGHMLGKLGLVAGVNFRMVEDEDTAKRRCHLSFGLTYIL